MRKLIIILIFYIPLLVHSQNPTYLDLKVVTKDSLIVTPKESHGYKLDVLNLRDSVHLVKDNRYFHNGLDLSTLNDSVDINTDNYYYSINLGFSIPDILINIIHETDTMTVMILSSIPYDSRITIPFLPGNYLLDLISIRERKYLEFDYNLKKNSYSLISQDGLSKYPDLTPSNWGKHKLNFFSNDYLNVNQSWIGSSDLIFRLNTDYQNRNDTIHFFSEAPKFNLLDYNFNIILNDSITLLKNNTRMEIDSVNIIYAPRYIALESNFIIVSTLAGSFHDFFSSLRIETIHNSDTMSIVLENNKNISVSRSLILDSVEFRSGNYEFNIDDILIQRYGGSFIEKEHRRDKAKMLFYPDRVPSPSGASYDITPFEWIEKSKKR